jgi:hypothetical protein
MGRSQWTGHVARGADEKWYKHESENKNGKELFRDGNILYCKKILQVRQYAYKRNIESRSRNHCCCGKAIRITYM